VLAKYYNLFSDFFNKSTLSCGGLLLALASDFTSETAKVKRAILTILGLKLTGPWTQNLFKNKPWIFSNTERHSK
jgi:hypothetical protein